jgi:hypothetical protein
VTGILISLENGSTRVTKILISPENGSTKATKILEVQRSYILRVRCAFIFSHKGTQRYTKRFVSQLMNCSRAFSPVDVEGTEYDYRHFLTNCGRVLLNSFFVSLCVSLEIRGRYFIFFSRPGSIPRSLYRLERPGRGSV